MNQHTHPKTILLAGATQGMGRAIAKKLLQLNYQVLGLGRSKHLQHDNYVAVPIDFAELKESEKILKQLFKQYNQLHGLVIGAGYGDFGFVEQFSLARIQQLMNVNFISQALLTKVCLPTLKKTPQSKIITIGSEAALQGSQRGSIYCASKAALKAFTEALRSECASAGIAVSLINPGMVNSTFFQTLDFAPGSHVDNTIDCQQIADTVVHIFHTANNCVFEQINLQPLKKVINKKPK